MQYWIFNQVSLALISLTTVGNVSFQSHRQYIVTDLNCHLRTWKKMELFTKYISNTILQNKGANVSLNISPSCENERQE